MVGKHWVTNFFKLQAAALFARALCKVVKKVECSKRSNVSCEAESRRLTCGFTLEDGPL